MAQAQNVNVLPDEVHLAVAQYLAAADRLLPGGITTAALSGSVALGAYRPRASDLDVVATIDDSWRGRPSLMCRLRALHLAQVPRLAGRILHGNRLSATCNTSFIWANDLTTPVTAIEPVASHVGELFRPAEAFDVNPVTWHELLHGGVPIRGPHPSDWHLDAESDRLRPWTRVNLAQYWEPLMRRVARRRTPLPASRVAWCLLGPARMHRTVTTGEVISKHDAGLHALDAFPEHAPILGIALAHLRREPLPSRPPRSQWRDLTVRSMRDILDASTCLPQT